MNGLDPSALAAYVSVTALLVLTPGSTTAVVIRNTIVGGVRTGIATAAGAAAGNMTHAAVAGAGLAWLLQRWPGAAAALRVGGAAYLGWLAFGSLAQAWRGTRSLTAAAGSDARDRPPSAFRDGLLVNLLNPPIITFYLMVPSFLPPRPAPQLFALFAAIHVSMAFVCHLGWSFAFGRLRSWLARPGAMRWLDAGAGVALLALAIRALV